MELSFHDADAYESTGGWNFLECASAMGAGAVVGGAVGGCIGAAVGIFTGPGVVAVAGTGATIGGVVGAAVGFFSYTLNW